MAAVAQLEAADRARQTAAERFSDAIARVAGTAWFAGLHVVWFAAWIAWNTGLVPGWRPIDPFPFSFLTLVVSLEAIFLSIFVLISQNNLTRQSERRAQLDLQINLLAEQESTKTVALLERIAQQLNVPVPEDSSESGARRADRHPRRGQHARQRAAQPSHIGFRRPTKGVPAMTLDPNLERPVRPRPDDPVRGA